MLKQRNWKAVHAFEDKCKRSFLRKLSQKESLKIYQDLYEFFYNTVNKNYFNTLDQRKIATLSRIHAMFNRVKE